MSFEKLKLICSLLTVGMKSQIVTICPGTNDSNLWNWKHKSEFFSDYMNMIRKFGQANPDVKVFVCDPRPVFNSNLGITDSIVHGEAISSWHTLLTWQSRKTKHRNRTS